MIKKSRIEKRLKIKNRISKKIRGTTERPRLTIYRSLHHMYAQIVDDSQAKTLVAASTLSPSVRDEIKTLKGKKEIAKRVGAEIGKLALEKKLSKVVFDRNGYSYHGVVKSLADAAREAGLKF
ncbi:MAG: 50S ribosomal protein L18 [Ignavibacteriales bacterium]|nr:50S ribosomal protein L18 [Ignavibacteriales bacterium]